MDPHRCWIILESVPYSSVLTFTSKPWTFAPMKNISIKNWGAVILTKDLLGAFLGRFWDNWIFSLVLSPMPPIFSPFFYYNPLFMNSYNFWILIQKILLKKTYLKKYPKYSQKESTARFKIWSSSESYQS